VQVARMVEAVPVEEAPTLAVVSRVGAHAVAEVPMATGTSTPKVVAARTEVVAPIAEVVPEEQILTAAGAPAVAEISTSKLGSASTVAAVSRAAAHAAAGLPMTVGTSTSKAGDAPTGVVAPTAEALPGEEILTAAGAPAVAEISTSKAGTALMVALLAEVSAEGTPTVAAVILRVAETSAPNAVEALTAAPMAEVTQAVEE